MKHAPNLFFIGPMGAGKTTVGRRVAQLLGLCFHDLDSDIEACTGVTVQTVFDIEGESGFREREAHALEKLTEKNGIVLATGGGAVLRESNRQLLQTRGFVVWLDAAVEVQLGRLRRDRQRPLLNAASDRTTRCATTGPAGDNGILVRRANLQRLAAERNPLYAELADLRVVSTGSGSSAQMAQQLVAQLAACWQPNAAPVA